MALHDRPYWRGGPGAQGSGFQRLAGGFPRPTRAVKYLLLITLGAFVLQLFVGLVLKFSLSAVLGLTPAEFWQVWRYVTFQFLHDPYSLWHVGLNMLGLYMFGTPLERQWGTRRFVEFYLSCGAAAGVAYVVASYALNLPGDVPLIGASGGVYGILLACAVLFPSMVIILVFFPVPIRLAAIIIFGGMVLFLLMSVRSGFHPSSFWSHVAHLGGAGMAAAWLWVIPKVHVSATEALRKAHRGAWRRKMDRRLDKAAEVDRILRKIHLEGIARLTRRERKILRDATRRQQKEENDLTRL
jgi:membrane associated rhomboid family serine protease